MLRRVPLVSLTSALLLLMIGCSQADQAAGQGRSSAKALPAEVKALMGPAATQSLIAALRDVPLCEQDYGIGATYISAVAILGGSRTPLNDLRAFEADLLKVSMPAESGKTPYKPCDEALLALRQDSALEMMARILAATGKGQEALPVLSELRNSTFRAGDAAELYAALGERKLALAVAALAQGKDRTKILAKVAVALVDRGDVSGAQEILAQMEELARPPVQARICALQGNWTEAWKLTQGASG